MTEHHGFPSDFFFGAATAGHQIEGNNVSSDCWALEQTPDTVFKHRSADAVDFYNRWPEDVRLTADLGLQALRFSVEWARVEPEPGQFSTAQLDHYRRLAARCHELGLRTVVTFNHWTTPLWFAAEGGWTNARAVDRFERYVDRAAEHLAGEVDWAITLNEPNVATVAAVGGGGVGGAAAGDLGEALEQATRRHSVGANVFRPMMLWDGDQLGRYTEAHRRARETIRSHMDVPVGWSLACVDYQPVPGFEDRAEALRRQAVTAWLEVSRDDDFVGVQNYTRRLVGADGVQKPAPDRPVDALGWELYPRSLANAVRDAASVSGRPVLVTEHGVCTYDDTLRREHTRHALRHLAAAVADGVEVRGYLHWTLLDEFEWFSGYDVTFGLVEVDRQTFARRPRGSATWLGDLAARRTRL
ncbi:family 1 glycosylhydrolase [Streptomyces sp. NPDC005820]|uniref:glycoside hydrolase family 1 protein n=1 Tax=Streptomyces sp. NPDC005820 TaxID=3157069 RepID=UPI0033E56628